MNFERRMHQQITYWRPEGFNDFGVHVFAVPETFVGRWEDKVQQIRTQEGEEITSKACIYTPVRLLIGGYLALGSFNDRNPVSVPAAFEIRDYTETPSIRTVQMERKAIL